MTDNTPIICGIDIIERDGEERVCVQAIRANNPMTVTAPLTNLIQKRLDDYLAGSISDAELLSSLSMRDIVSEVRDEVAPKIERVSENLAFDGCHITYQGRNLSACLIDEVLEDHLVRLIKSGTKESELAAWAAFTERLYNNACEHTRSHIVRWLKSQGWLTIDAKGRLVGYRGCAWDDDLDCPVSVHAGPAIVDGVSVNGHVPNRLGSIVEMPRNQVEHNPAHGCSTGLHVGTYAYACSWAPVDGAVLRVAVAPEDIVSVPTECNSAKIRCCRFEVLDVQRKEFVPTDEWEDDTTIDQDELEDLARDLRGQIADAESELDDLHKELEDIEHQISESQTC